MMVNLFSANASALGYLHQVRFALYLFLQAVKENPECALSIERLDDVAFEQDGTPIELIQVKHVQLRQASLTNSSSDLWKTLRIWSLKAISDRDVIPQIVLTLVTTGQAGEGSAAAKLRQGRDRDEEGALRILRDVLQGSTSEANQKAYEAFSALSSDEQYLLLSRIRVVDNSPGIVDVRERILREIQVYSRHAVSLYTRLEGWWFGRAVDNLINNSQLNTISGDELTLQIQDLISQLQDDNLPNEFPGIIPAFTEMEESDLSERERVFVEQLKLVLVGPSRLRLAIGHYYRAFQQRTRWLDEGLIYPRELEEYERYLEGEWRTQFEIMRERLGEVPNEEEMQHLGRELFNVTDTTPARPIRTRFVDSSFSRGSYHLLANEGRIGWHAEFQQRIAHLMVAAARQAS